MLRVIASRARVTGLLALGFAFLAGVAAGQTPTGTITGQVTDAQGAVIRGVTVTVSSPSLIGTQTATTTDEGAYIVRGLPPGRYTVTLEATGFNKVTRAIDIAPTQRATVSAEMVPATVVETINVSTEADSFVNTVQGARNITSEQVRELPTARTLLSYIDLTPAVHGTGPGGNRMINGAMSFENVFLMNGVQIQDNLRGQPLDLFIEDAIEETTVSSSGISAEFGRFSGGIVNAVTKSGGNEFSGSLRLGFTNDNWRSVTPENEPKIKSTVPTYEFTFGGPVWRDRTWFFGAGRFFDRTEARETVEIDEPYEYRLNEKRFEAKLTHSFAPAHRVHGSYIGIERSEDNYAPAGDSAILDLRSLASRELPENLASVGYTGTFGAKFFVDAHYSVRNSTFVGPGGKNADLIQGTSICAPSIDCLGGSGLWSWAPLFCGVCRDDERDNDQFVLKGSYFVSTGAGAHNVTFGYDRFTDKVAIDNHQSASGFHVWASDYVIENGTVYPVLAPNGSTFIINWPVLTTTQGTKFRTDGLFFNDNWTVNDQLSLQLGLRYDRNDGVDANGDVVADDSAVSPRLGLTFSPNRGSTTVNASFGRYVPSLANTIAGAASPAGNPATIVFAYFGEGINDSGGPLVPTDVALQQAFDWLASVPDEVLPFILAFADVPGQSTRFPRSLKSPHTDEIAIGAGQTLGRNASFRIDFVNRKAADFYMDQVDQSTGQVVNEFGFPSDVRHIVNSNAVSRRFRALNAQLAYHRGARTSLGVSYSLSRLWGNIDGETAGSGPLSSQALSYPEYSDPAWSNPIGDLGADQRHRARIFGHAALPFPGNANVLSLGFNQIVESGTPYGAVGLVDTFFFVDNPGYALPPVGVSYYFTPRDEFRTDTMFRTDVALNFARRLNSRRPAELFAQFQLLNVFNRFQVFNLTGGAINTTVRTSFNDQTLAPFDPFTETPVEGVHWRKDANFGEPRSEGAYTQPRLFRFSVGFRF